MDTIGFLEVTSIAKGVEISDAMLKSSYVKLVFSRASCPGKYYVMVTGDVSGVETSVKEGLNIGKGFVVYSTVLPKIHPQVFSAINAGIIPDSVPALGIMEFYSVTASLTAADKAAKTARVDIMDIRLGTGIGGKSFVLLAGELTSVKSAVEAAINTLKDSGMLVSQAVISNPKKELVEALY